MAVTSILTDMLDITVQAVTLKVGYVWLLLTHTYVGLQCQFSVVAVPIKYTLTTATILLIVYDDGDCQDQRGAMECKRMIVDMCCCWWCKPWAKHASESRFPHLEFFFHISETGSCFWVAVSASAATYIKLSLASCAFWVVDMTT